MTGWRLNDDSHIDDHFRDGEREVCVRVHFRRSGFEIEVGKEIFVANGSIGDDGRLSVNLDGEKMSAGVVADGDAVHVFLGGEEWAFTRYNPFAFTGEEEMGAGALTAPMPGKVVQVMVEDGATVEKGQPLVILEAMKMEHTIAAPANGTVTAVHFQAGDLVGDGDELIAFEPKED